MDGVTAHNDMGADRSLMLGADLPRAPDATTETSTRSTALRLIVIDFTALGSNP
ncbi:hypothetical protein KKG46_00400 [Patescibacteria group bacterium]|nr:hypothetical protein [Patescibacteria group bacterium]